MGTKFEANALLLWFEPFHLWHSYNTRIKVITFRERKKKKNTAEEVMS